MWTIRGGFTEESWAMTTQRVHLPKARRNLFLHVSNWLQKQLLLSWFLLTSCEGSTTKLTMTFSADGRW